MSTIFAQDTFVRANTAGNTTISNAAGWGTSSDGNTWSETGTGATYSIASNTGKITGTVNVILPTLSSTTKQDGDVLCRMQCSAVATAHMGVIFRQTAATTYYRAELSGGGTNSFTISKIVTGTGTDLATGSFTYTAGQLCWIRLRCVGSTISGKVWLDGNSEPTSWTLSATDTAITGVGNFGIKCKLGAAGDTAQYDSFKATDAVSTLTVSMRTPVRTLHSLSTGMRLVVRGITKVTNARLVVRTQKTISTSMRTPVRTLHSLSIGVRAIVRGITRVAPVRVVVQVITTRVLSIRLPVRSQVTDTLTCRIVLRGTSRVISIRLVVVGGASVSAGFVPSGMSFPPYLGPGNIFPLFPLTTPRYVVNGVPLGDVPTVMTTPLAIGGIISAGSVFLLIFSNPSGATTAALADGSTVTLTFSILGTWQVTGQVLLSATLAAGMFQVQCTTLAPILCLPPTRHTQQ